MIATVDEWTDVNGELTAADRLARIEAALERIEQRMEKKVSGAEFERLDQRVRDIELHGTRTAQETLARVNEIRSEAEKQLDDLAVKVEGQGLKLARYAGAIGAVVVLVNVGELLIQTKVLGH